MCDLVSEFILCTCQEKSGNEKNEKTYTDYKWTLQVKVHYPKQNPTYGKAKCQSKNLGEGLTEKFVLKQLNSKNCFDFDYHPSEGDDLLLESLHRKTTFYQDFLYFRYSNGKWVEDFFYPFDKRFESKIQGKLKPLSYRKERAYIKKWKLKTVIKNIFKI